MQKLLAIVYLALLTSALYGQPVTGSVMGKIVDSNGNPVVGVSLQIRLLSEPHAVGSWFSQPDGSYRLSPLKGGRYILTASHSGFSSRSDTFQLAENTQLQREPMVLREIYTHLKQVQVVAGKKAIEVHNGKLILNAEQTPSASGISVMELLQRAPGVSLDQQENLLLKGSATVNVMIDGRKTYLSGQQLSNLLKGMSSETINRIEIVTTPGAQYDASGNTGIINIITRKSNKLGYAANVSAGIGASHFLLTSENWDGNIKTQKINIFGNFGYNYQPYFANETNHQVTSYNGQPAIFSRAFTDVHQSRFYSYKLGVDLSLDKRQDLGLVYTGSFDDWVKNAAGPTIVGDQQGAIIAVRQNKDLAKEPYKNAAYNLNYTFNIDSLGTQLTADADYLSYRNKSDGFLGNATYDASGTPLQPYQQLNIHQPSFVDIYSIKTDLAFPIGGWKTKMGLKYSSVTINNDFRYDSVRGGIAYFDSSLSDHFIYKEQIAAGYLSASRQWKKMSLEAGLRVEHTYSDGNSINTGQEEKATYANLFPSLSLEHPLNKMHKLGLSMSRRINRPGYGNLNPVRYFSDKYSYYQGNPHLVPEIGWIGALSYTLMEKYIATFTYTRLSNYIAQSMHVDAASGALVTSNTNYPHKHRYEVLLVTPVELKPGWTINAMTNVSYSEYPLILLRDSHTVKRWVADLTVNPTFRLFRQSLLDIRARYSSPDAAGIYISRSSFSVDAGYKMSFREGKLEVRLNCTDVFHTLRWTGVSASSSIQSSYSDKPDSRRLRLTAIYHLGGKLTGGKARQLEERSRL
ncbi:MAG TPA: TonB-dependent receptor [Puia sp.]|uniref:TonB-dependent receptor n=1 Tax=Puia sp. TaxID=2045100 RepID=UPI002BC12752|nr:TonB-dependent receptor [Puia sp.]HVU94689.1 TonB-dependent receptor [Puia sp.]